MIFRSSLVAGILVAACGVVFGGDWPGKLKRLPREGSYTVEVGDLILIALDQHPPTGRANPAEMLKVDIKGKGLSTKCYVVTAPPARPSPNGDEIQAYIPAESEG